MIKREDIINMNNIVYSNQFDRFISLFPHLYIIIHYFY